MAWLTGRPGAEPDLPQRSTIRSNDGATSRAARRSATSAMRGDLEHLAAAPRARVLGDHRLAIEHADRVVVDDERADLLGVVARDGVAIGVDAHGRLAIDLDRLDARGLGQRIGERQEAVPARR
jgi:hypothetical protein